MPRKLTRILSFFLCFLLIFEQSGFAQVAGQLDISGHFLQLRNSFLQDKFRPLHLRYLSYDSLNNNFKLLLDKGDFEKTQGLSPKGTVPEDRLKQATKTLLHYFFIGISLPNSTFWVNLRPDSEDNVIDADLAKTDIGRILLEQDLQLKKDTAKATSPETPEGREYWDKLYKKSEELFGQNNITIPTLTRPWIVPDEIIIRETPDNAYIYKATLKVMLEEDYLRDSPLRGQSLYSFKDERLKTLNEYSSQLLRELIIPKLTKEINTAKRYAPLRQVYYSLILAQWFKSRFYGKGGLYSWLIDRKNLNGLTSPTPWSKTTYFKEYQKSFEQGEYNIKEPAYTAFGQTIRSYMSGGIALQGIITGGSVSSPTTFIQPANNKKPVVASSAVIEAEFLGSKEVAYNGSINALSPNLSYDEGKKRVASSPMENNYDQKTYNVINALKNAIEQGDERITFKEFMRISHYSEGGYYSAGQVKIGNGIEANSDFVTYPELAPLTFGYGIAEQIFQMWNVMDRPSHFQIVEMGAGNGTWAHRILEYLKETHPELFNALDYIIVEISPELVKRQRRKLEDKGYPVRWVLGSAVDLPLKDIEGVFISNELPDAFPVHKVKKDVNGELKEVYVVHREGVFKEELGEISDEDIKDYIQLLQKARGDEYVNKILATNYIAVNLDMVKWQKAISDALKRGYVITIDYGFDADESQQGNYPLRIYSDKFDRKDQTANPDKYIYEYPGQVDITSDIDFRLLEKIGIDVGLKIEGKIDQYGFFIRLAGISKKFWKTLVDLHNTADNSFKVIVQSKGVPKSDLIGLKHGFTLWDIPVQEKVVDWIIAIKNRRPELQKMFREAIINVIIRFFGLGGADLLKLIMSAQQGIALEQHIHEFRREFPALTDLLRKLKGIREALNEQGVVFTESEKWDIQFVLGRIEQLIDEPLSAQPSVSSPLGETDKAASSPMAESDKVGEEIKPAEQNLGTDFVYHDTSSKRMAQI